MTFNTRRIYRLLITSSLEGIVFLLLLIFIPTENQKSNLLGYSTVRLLMMAGIFTISLLFWKLSTFVKNNKEVGGRFPTIWEKTLSKTFFILGIAIIALVSLFFFTQWLFLGKDDFLRAYLQRLSPLVGYLGIISIQVIIFIYLNIGSKEKLWTLQSIILGMLTLLPWLLVFEYQIAKSAFPEYYVVEGFYSQYQVVLFISIFVTTLYVQFFIAGLKKNRGTKPNLLGIFIPLFIIFGYFYYDAAMQHAKTTNITLNKSDQGAYIDFSKKVAETNYTYTGTRNQMPLYPYLQSIFYQPGLGDDEFFEKGKMVNIILSMILLSGLFFVFKHFFSIRRTSILTLIPMTSLFIFKAPYFQAELLCFFLSFLGVLFMGLMLIKPSFKLGGATGIILALAHLTKASILPAVLSFTLVFLLQIGVKFLRKEHTSHKQKYLYSIGTLVFTLGVFLLVLFPYINESKKTYGQYFYNVNSTFYIWYDTWEEAINDTYQYGYREHWPNLPPEEIPSFQKYMREHSIEQIKDRFSEGSKRVFTILTGSYSHVSYLSIYSIALFLFFISVTNWNEFKKYLAQYWAILVFALFSISGYLLLYSWYSTFAGGPRFVHGLFLPLIFFVFIVLDRVTKLPPRFQSICPKKLLNILDTVMLGVLICDFYYVITIALPTGYFGT